ncbi:MAG: isoaspartyl peptidase/L-asparaginase [Candidatus Liptonbacteria bacterium]|nr:isoaspartyl peptidase/L-asparaginase [Candidatus Liptonbacteria bacterium]
MKTSFRYTLVVHGGAGILREPERHQVSIERILRHGGNLLREGKSAVEVVEECVVMFEDDPELYNAGRNSVLNDRGEVEMDAAIMDGATLCAGTVGNVTLVRNPIRLARLVMEKTEHVMLAGDGALEFARSQGVPLEPKEYFITQRRLKEWRAAKLKSRVVKTLKDYKLLIPPKGKKLGTVGAVARDRHGNLAAATSTGGLVNKKYGRIGDTPIVGAGTYADNATCAVSATGQGEQIMRAVLAKKIAEIIWYEKTGAQEAAVQGIECFARTVSGLGGVIVIDAQGRWGAAHSTPNMKYGVVTEGTQPRFFVG